MSKILSNSYNLYSKYHWWLHLPTIMCEAHVIFIGLLNKNCTLLCSMFKFISCFNFGPVHLFILLFSSTPVTSFTIGLHSTTPPVSIIVLYNTQICMYKLCSASFRFQFWQSKHQISLRLSLNALSCVVHNSHIFLLKRLTLVARK